MNSKISITEEEYRTELINSKRYFFESQKGQNVLTHIRKLCGEVHTIYALAHTPEQGEDIFRILVNGEKIIGLDLQDEDNNFAALNITTYSIKEYERLVNSRMARLKLSIALSLSKADLQLKNM